MKPDKNISEVLTDIDTTEDFLDDTIDLDTVDASKDPDDDYQDEDVDDDDDESFNRRWYGG